MDQHDKGIVAVASAPIVDGISVTLVRDADGWRFHGWAKLNDSPLGIQPTDTDRNLRFVTSEGASAYFKQTYASLLRAR